MGFLIDTRAERHDTEWLQCSLFRLAMTFIVSISLVGLIDLVESQVHAASSPGNVLLDQASPAKSLVEEEATLLQT